MMTEEMWFPYWENGGAPWDLEKPAARRHYVNSPHKLIRNWKTPIMVTHGEMDYRVPVEQGMAAFPYAAFPRGEPLDSQASERRPLAA